MTDREHAIQELKDTIIERQKRFPELINQGKIALHVAQKRINGLQKALFFLDPDAARYTGRNFNQKKLKF